MKTQNVIIQTKTRKERNIKKHRILGFASRKSYTKHHFPTQWSFQKVGRVSLNVKGVGVFASVFDILLG
jgi:hypothetical protein